MKPYHYSRYSWYTKISIDALKEKLSDFDVIDRPMPSSEWDTSIYKNERDGIQCKADNLSAFLYEFKAVMYQKDFAPFTKKDLMMREIVLDNYPRSRSSFLSTGIQREPYFEII